jgi:hypothetical protein
LLWTFIFNHEGKDSQVTILSFFWSIFLSYWELKFAWFFNFDWKQNSLLSILLLEIRSDEFSKSFI